MSAQQTPPGSEALQTEPPFDALRLARAEGRKGLGDTIAIQTVRIVLRLGFSAMAAIAVGHLVMDRPAGAWPAVLAIFFLCVAALANFACDRVQAAAEAGVATRLREAACQRLCAMPARRAQSLSSGRLVIAMQRYPECVAALVISHRAATMMMAIGPLLAAGMLFVVSWEAAVLVICLTPVMIAFFALVGDAIRRRATAQEQAFGRLAGQFGDRIRTLPTILANHALPTEQAKLASRLETYAHETMGVLGIAFINAGIIDFFASLSIAVLAVLLGLGHLKLIALPGFAHLELWQSLFILMIAPDYFAPFRRFSEQYHAKAEGLAAAVSLDGLLNDVSAASPVVPVLDKLAFALPSRGLIAVTGPSGSGKTTMLRQLAVADHETLPGNVVVHDVVWVSTDSPVSGGTLADAIGWNLGDVRREELSQAAAAVGLLDERMLPGGLDAVLARGGANLSGGQRLRISVARALLARKTILADEPTAKLDSASAALVRRALLDMARSHLVVVATHDDKLAAAASQVIDLTNHEKLEAAA